MTSPVRVLHVLGALEPGGVETWLLNLTARLDRSRWQFDFCTLGPAPGRYARVAHSQGCRVVECPLRGPGGWRGIVGFGRRLYRILRAGGYRVVHSHVHHFSGFVLAVAKAAGVPVRVAHSHNTHDGHRDTLARDLYRSLGSRLLDATQTSALACSAAAAGALFGSRWREDARVRVVHYGVEVELTCREDGKGGSHVPRARLRREWGLSENVPVVGHVGRMEKQKNHAFLLEVAAALKDRRPEVRWLLVGDGPERSELERNARRMGLEGGIVFAGCRDDVHKQMRYAIDALVLPSLYEGLPLVLLEAQAAGLRTLVSSRVTAEAAVVQGAVEFLPLEAGPRVWAQRTVACLDRGRICSAEAGRRLQAAGFSIDQSLERLIEIYQTSSGPVEYAFLRV